MCGPKREEIAGGWRRLHNEFHNLYTSPNVIRVIKSRWIKWVGQVWERRKMHTQFWSENLNVRDHFENLGRILEWMLGRGLDSSGSGQGPVAGCCEHGNEHSDSMKVTGRVDYLTDLSVSQRRSSVELGGFKPNKIHPNFFPLNLNYYSKFHYLYNWVRPGA
jgi:hypothetical protein